MRKVLLLLLSIACTQQIFAQGIYVSEASSIYTQNFDSLSSIGEQNVFMPAGWSYREVGNSTYADGFYGTDLSLGINPNIYSLGDDTVLAEYITNPDPSDRALGLQVHKVFYPNPRIGAKITNVDPTKAIGGFMLSYRGETWIQHQITQVDTLKFYYSTDADSVADPAATWINVPGLDYTMEAEYNILDGYFYNYAGNTTFSTGKNNMTISGSVPFSTLNVPPGESVYISWVPTCNVGTYSTVGGIDNINLNALFGPVNVSVGSVTHTQNNFNISTFPNPAVDVLNVQTYYAKGNVNYTITNSVGLVVKKGDFPATGVNGEYKIELGGLPSGIYLARFMNADSKVITKNFVKQ